MATPDTATWSEQDRRDLYQLMRVAVASIYDRDLVEKTLGVITDQRDLDRASIDVQEKSTLMAKIGEDYGSW